MATFRFALQPLLTLRKRDEDEAALAVAAIQREKRELELRVAQAQRLIDEAGEGLRDMVRTGRVDARGLRAQARSGLAARATTARLGQTMDAVDERLGAARQALAQAASKRRAIELLRERRFDAWKREREAREQAELDDHAVMRHSCMAFGVDSGVVMGVVKGVDAGAGEGGQR